MKGHFQPRHCKTCGGVMTRHATLNLWKCKFFTCPNFDRPHYEKRVTKKAVAAALKAMA